MDILDVEGRIFDIQKFSVHDGPGIRTIVFLKGCPLRCRWCCNPESQEHEIQKMVMGNKTVAGEDTTVREVITEVMKDFPYYRRSGGGMTLSGGEAYFQHEFAKALFMAAHDSGINTAIETTSMTKFEIIEEISPHIDYYMMDIKHMNSEKHKAFTRVPNEIILENAKKLSNIRDELTIRVPVIPTFNDTEEEISAIAEFASTLKCVSQLHLLPYHRLGLDKYKALGRTYTLEGIVPPTDDKMNSLKRAVERTGLYCQIGG